MKRESDRYREITLQPSMVQFIIDELPLLTLCAAGWAYGGMEDVPLGTVATLFAVLLSLHLAYRLVYLKRIRYRVGSERLVSAHGVFQRSTGYIELYRVVDFQERQTLLQQVFGLKSVTVFSTDRTTPRLEMTGLPKRIDIVDIIRERVEYNRQTKGIHEITNL